MPESPRFVLLHSLRCLFEFIARWLIDSGHNAYGMRVIADLHGGDPDNPSAVSEYEEIKDKVREEVGSTEYSLEEVC